MKIYFPNITFQGSPFIWELDEKSHQATCLLYCIKKETHVQFEPPVSPDMFKKFPGVIIDNEAVIIKDIRTFNATYKNLDQLNEPKSKITQPGTLLKQKSSFFGSQKDKIPGGGTSSSKLQKRSLSYSSLPLYSRIILDELIKNDHANSSLWGDTVAYETYFEEKTSNDSKTRGAIFLKSLMSFNVMVQYEKNRRLYPLKSKLIKEIRGLLDVLDPIYMSWIVQEENTRFSRKSIFRYFQNAVLEAMLNGTLNNKPTEFEVESSKLTPALQKYAINKARALRAELMLMKFNVLINQELPLELSLSEKKAKKFLSELASLREHILVQPKDVLDDIKVRLERIAELIIKSGIIEESNKQLSMQLNHEFSIKAPVIMGFHSFQALLQTLLENQLTDNKKGLIPDIVIKVTKETITQIDKTFAMEHTQYFARLSTLIDSNFYLHQEWANQLAIELAAIKLKHPKDEKKVTAYSQLIAEKVVDFLHHQLHEYAPTQDGVATTNSMFIM
ncbi:hypothetical protein [Legionella tucsonensis]|uniref:Uncharacterized protein n=1 Tax=Legionella tucsonensis TaxID=40335 RepID=A0A0W0ZUG7_9GAMM|nr:hypothetical protein [Legionella tucsonensis]KTD72827.1 hypothetical protein Ltuc_0674 [Legionella tucsonensis]